MFKVIIWNGSDPDQSWDKFPELGTRKFCRDNVTMLSGHKVVCICHFTIFVVASPSRHRGLTIFQNFSGPWLFLEALLRCRIVVVAKLKNCRMPSSANFVIRIQIDHIICFILKSNIYNYIMIGEPGHSASGQLGHRSSERHFQPGKSRGL